MKTYIAWITAMIAVSTLAFAAGCARWLLLAEVRQPMVILALQPLHAVSFALYYVAGVTLTREQASVETQTAAQGLFAAAFAG